VAGDQESPRTFTAPRVTYGAPSFCAGPQLWAAWRRARNASASCFVHKSNRKTKRQCSRSAAACQRICELRRGDATKRHDDRQGELERRAAFPLVTLPHGTRTGNNHKLSAFLFISARGNRVSVTLLRCVGAWPLEAGRADLRDQSRQRDLVLSTGVQQSDASLQHGEMASLSFASEYVCTA